MNREEIKKILPHREPMLLVDEAVMENGLCRGSYAVKGDEFFLQGHFPGNPVVPGVILCEMMAQSACLLAGFDAGDVTPYFTGLNNVKFRRKVVPGDRVEFTTEMVKQKGPFFFLKGEGRVKGELAVSGEFSFAAVKQS